MPFWDTLWDTLLFLLYETKVSHPDAKWHNNAVFDTAFFSVNHRKEYVIGFESHRFRHKKPHKQAVCAVFLFPWDTLWDTLYFFAVPTF